MFIRVERDILESAYNSDPTSPYLFVLLELSVAIRRGKHFVFIPDWMLYRDRLSFVMSKSSFVMLDSLKRLDGYIMNANIGRKMIVTDDDTVAHNDGDIIVSPANASSLEMFEETHLLCENINEKKFYEKVENFYRRHYANEFVLDTRFCVMPRNGGGASSASVLEAERQIGNHLLVIIADSDYKFCFQVNNDGVVQYDKGSKGTTASKLEEIQINNPYRYSEIYVLEQCREVENLIPLQFLKDFHPNNNPQSISFIDSNDMEYFDVKEGIRIEHMYDDKVLQYWENSLQTIGYDTQKILDVKATHTSKSKYKKFLKTASDEESRQNFIIEGWGGSILKDTLNARNSDYNTLGEDDLTPSQLHEWRSIGKILFEWGLASRPSFA